MNFRRQKLLRVPPLPPQSRLFFSWPALNRQLDPKTPLVCRFFYKCFLQFDNLAYSFDLCARRRKMNYCIPFCWMCALNASLMTRKSLIYKLHYFLYTQSKKKGNKTRIPEQVSLRVILRVLNGKKTKREKKCFMYVPTYTVLHSSCAKISRESVHNSLFTALSSRGLLLFICFSTPPPPPRNLFRALGSFVRQNVFFKF